jgi:WD40 repeat protein
MEGHSHTVTSVAFSPNGVHVVSGSRDATVLIWDATTGAEVTKIEGHSNSVTSVAFSADGARFVSGSEDKTVRIWDARTGDARMGNVRTSGKTRFGISLPNMANWPQVSN